MRSTASLEYTRPMPGGSWASSFIWGRTTKPRRVGNVNSYLAESVLPIHRESFLTGRVELVDKDELFEDQPQIQREFGYFVWKYLPDWRVYHRIHERRRSVPGLAHKNRDRHRRQTLTAYSLRTRSSHTMVIGSSAETFLSASG